MRAIFNISLPPAVASLVRREVKYGKYASVSEFFRTLLRTWEEERLLASLHKSQRQIARGKGRVLRSLRDLR